MVRRPGLHPELEREQPHGAGVCRERAERPDPHGDQPGERRSDRALPQQRGRRQREGTEVADGPGPRGTDGRAGRCNDFCRRADDRTGSGYPPGILRKRGYHRDRLLCPDQRFLFHQRNADLTDAGVRPGGGIHYQR